MEKQRASSAQDKPLDKTDYPKHTGMGELSSCHHAPVRVEGKTTKSYYCNQCNQACDLWIPTQPDYPEPARTGEENEMHNLVIEETVKSVIRDLRKNLSLMPENLTRKDVSQLLNLVESEFTDD